MAQLQQQHAIDTRKLQRRQLALQEEVDSAISAAAEALSQLLVCVDLRLSEAAGEPLELGTLLECLIAIIVVRKLPYLHMI